MRKPSVRAVALTGAAAVVLAGGGFAGYAGYQSANDRSLWSKGLTLVVDGEARQVSTRETTVGALLKAQNIVVGERDSVAPSLDAELSDNGQISVAYGRKVNLTVDGVHRSVWTTSRTVAGLMNQLNMRATDGAWSVSRSAAIGRAGLNVNLATRKDVSLTVGGKPQAASTTGSKVADALKAAKVTVGKSDKVSPALTAKLRTGMKITVVRVKATMRSITKPVPFAAVRKNDDGLLKGTTRVATKGRNGVLTRTYKQTWNDSKVVATVLVGQKVTTAPVTQVTLVGTKVPPPPPPPEPNRSDSDSKRSANSDDADDKSDSNNSDSDSDSDSSETRSSNSDSGDVSPARGSSCKASYYWEPQPTASGEPFDPSAMTAAHKTLPLGSRVKVTYNGNTVIVRINDRGPYISGRCLDLSKAAFGKIADLNSGVVRVTYEVL